MTSFCSRAFEEAGYETSIANDGNEAVRLLNEDRPDVVLLDLVLPGIDGVHLMKHIRSHPDFGRIPVLIVSNSGHFSGLVKAACSAGATQFIHKGDLSPAGLVEEVRKFVPPTGYIAPESPPDLPIDYQPSASDEAKGRAANTIGKLPKTALIADDDRVIHGVLSFFLGRGRLQGALCFRWQAGARTRTSGKARYSDHGCHHACKGRHGGACRVGAGSGA